MNHSLRLFSSGLAAIFLLASGWACARSASEELLELINSYRAQPAPCQGRRAQPLAPLAPEPALAQLKLGEGEDLAQALRDTGYRAARAQVLILSGPRNAQEAMQIIAERNCRLLQDKRYVAAGVSREGSHWQIVLAQPMLPTDLPAWREAGKQVLQQVNQARAQARTCGDREYASAPALAWNQRLADTARGHSRDMAQHDYFSHEGRDGSTVGERARRQDYRWQRIGENIASGQGTPQQVVAGWLSSPGHCANVMNPAFTEMGAAYAINRESDTAIFWTQVLGTPR